MDTLDDASHTVAHAAEDAEHAVTKGAALTREEMEDIYAEARRASDTDTVATPPYSRDLRPRGRRRAGAADRRCARRRLRAVSPPLRPRPAREGTGAAQRLFSFLPVAIKIMPLSPRRNVSSDVKELRQPALGCNAHRTIALAPAPRRGWRPLRRHTSGARPCGAYERNATGAVAGHSPRPEPCRFRKESRPTPVQVLRSLLLHESGGGVSWTGASLTPGIGRCTPPSIRRLHGPPRPRRRASQQRNPRRMADRAIETVRSAAQPPHRWTGRAE